MSYTGNTPRVINQTYRPQAADPANPIEGMVFRSDGTSRPVGLYEYKSGAWSPVGSGAGSQTYISNSTFDENVVGWVTYADAAAATPVDGTGGTANITFTRTTSTPLDGTGSGLITKDAANRQGQGVSADFTIDRADLAQILRVSFNYEIPSGTYADGDIRIYVYDVTNAVMIEMPQRDLGSVSGSGKYVTSFQTSSNSTSYRLIMHIATTSASAYTIKLDNVIVFAQPLIKGAMVTDEVDIVPTISSFGTVTANTASVSRVGDKMIVSGRFTSGTPIAASASVTIPFNLSLAAQHTGSTFVAGTWTRDVTNEVTAGKMLVNIANSSLLIFFGNAQSLSSGALNPLAIANASNIIGAGNVISYQFEVSIAGWSSNLVLSEDTGNRLIEVLCRGTTGPATGTVNVTNLTFGTTELADTTDSYNVSTGIFTAPESGFYSFSGSMNTNVASGSGVTPFINGTTTSMTVGITEGITGIATFAGKVYLVKADQLSFRTNSWTAVSSGAFLSISKMATPQTLAGSEIVAVRAVQSSAQSIPNNTLTTITWDAAKTYDTHNALNTTTGVFTAPVSGNYRVLGQLTFAGGTFGAVGGVVDGQISKNGAAFSLFTTAVQTASTFNIISIATDTVPLLRGETITIELLQVAGGSRPLSANNLRNYISITKVN